MSPQEAVKFGNRCPVCRRSLTKGVEQRVEELADRPAGTKPSNAIGYVHLLPLSEIITSVLGVTYPGVQRVWEPYNALIAKFGDEYTVLIDAPKDKMAEVVKPEIAEAIIRVRENKIKVVPGYDGVYGQPIFSENAREMEQKTSKPVKQRSLADFI
jgi:PHP family Zn ribbon phosphoesterase